jgi:hypothetical protein
VTAFGGAGVSFAFGDNALCSMVRSLRSLTG